MKAGTHSVDFNEDLHQYKVDGHEVLSVTQFIKRLNPDKYTGVSEKTLQSASKRGTALHNAVEIYEQDGLPSNDIQEFRDYCFLKKHYGWEVVAQEKVVVLQYRGVTLAGRFDQLQQLGDKLIIADLKNTATLDKEALAIQLNLYKMAFEQTYEMQVDGLKGIWLYKGKRKYIDIPVNYEHTIELLEQYRKEVTE